MVKATLRTAKPTAAHAPPIDVVATPVNEKIKSTAGIGTGTGTEDLTSILPEQTPPGEQEAAGPHAGQQPPTTAIATRPVQSVARHAPQSVEGFEGEWGGEDVKFPQLKLVQGSGPLSQEYDNGTVIFGEDELLPPASVKEGAPVQSLKFAPISITKQWREKLGQDQVVEGLQPRIVSTIAEVEELGGTTRWVGDSRPDNFWEPSARCILLIEAPEGTEHPGFALELDRKLYAVGVYYAAGIAFRDSAKIIFNTAMTSLLVPILDNENKPVLKNGRPQKRPMLYKNFWRLSFAKKTLRNSSFTPWEPVVKLLSKEETGPEARAFCESITGNAVETAAPAE